MERKLKIPDESVESICEMITDNAMDFETFSRKQSFFHELPDESLIELSVIANPRYRTDYTTTDRGYIEDIVADRLNLTIDNISIIDIDGKDVTERYITKPLLDAVQKL